MASDGTYSRLCRCYDEVKPIKKKLKLPFIDLMHEYIEAHKEKCWYLQQIKAEMKPVQVQKLYPTGTTYEGMATFIGMDIYGTYTMPHGVAYKGDLDEEGMFHGEGELIYPSGNFLRGKWEHGDFVGKRQLFFDDSIVFLEDNWTYCHMPDRRFSLELMNGIPPAGNSYICADPAHKEIPLGYYDCGQGYYLPSFKCIYALEDLTEIVRSPAVQEQEWIVRNCRKSPDLPVGPIPDFYETFYKPTPQLDPTYEGDSYQSPSISYANEDTVSTLSSASATLRWNRFHQMSIDCWLKRAGQYFTSSGGTHISGSELNIELDSTTGPGHHRKPLSLQNLPRSASGYVNIDKKETKARHRITKTIDQMPHSPGRINSSNNLKKEIVETPSIKNDKEDIDESKDNQEPERKQTKPLKTFNEFRRPSSISSRQHIPHSSMKINQSNLSLNSHTKLTAKGKPRIKKQGIPPPIFEINVKPIIKTTTSTRVKPPSPD